MAYFKVTQLIIFSFLCSQSSEGAVNTKVISQYFEVIEHDMNRVFFVQNKNPDDFCNDTDIQACKINNKIMAEKIITTLRRDAKETVTLQSKYKKLTEAYNKLRTPKEKKGTFV